MRHKIQGVIGIVPPAGRAVQRALALGGALEHPVQSNGVEVHAGHARLDHAGIGLGVNGNDDGLLHDDLFGIVQSLPAGGSIAHVLAGGAVGDDGIVLGVAENRAGIPASNPNLTPEIESQVAEVAKLVAEGTIVVQDTADGLIR